MNVLGRLVLLAAAAALGVACGSKVQAREPVAQPPLEMPAPPGRVVIPVTVKVPEPVPPPTEPEPPAPARPPAATGAPPTRPPEKTPPETAARPPVLQTTSNTAALEKEVRDLVMRARADLARVDRARLSANARDQYDTAQRFIRMAEEALGIKNYVYARQLAESAAALAGALVR